MVSGLRENDKRRSTPAWGSVPSPTSTPPCAPTRTAGSAHAGADAIRSRGRHQRDHRTFGCRSMNIMAPACDRTLATSLQPAVRQNQRAIVTMMGKSILLIEDDVRLGEQIVDRLRSEGFEVMWRTEGSLLDPRELDDIALVILDLLLPGIYGLDILRDVRQHTDTPFLILSARDDTHDKVRALRLGADDYMTKPFWPDELIERVRARLRRPAIAWGDTIHAGALR